MYPYLINIWQFQVSTFWLSVTICFFLFIWMFYKMSKKLDLKINIFKNNLILFFLSIFFFSRLFYIISKWNDYKSMVNPLYFFITDDYNFSLIWGILWFLIMFYILLKIKKEKSDNYIYPLVLSFIFVLPLWFFWALLGGQVYWIDTNFWIEISYSWDTKIPYILPIFPLPIFYSILFFLLFCWLYISNLYFKEKNILWYGWIMIFACIIFIMDFFNWKPDIFKDYLFLNLSQISAIFLLWFWWYKIYNIYKKETKRWKM